MEVGEWPRAVSCLVIVIGVGRSRELVVSQRLERAAFKCAESRSRRVLF